MNIKYGLNKILALYALITLYACFQKLTKKCKEVGGAKTKSRPALIRA
jgi:hypothetical protein